MRLVSDERNGSLCPNSMFEPTNAQHQARAELLNRLYEASPRDEDGETTPELDAVYMAAKGTDDFMRLYKVDGFDSSSRTSVVGYFWRCAVCGLILPGQGVPR